MKKRIGTLHFRLEERVALGVLVAPIVDGPRRDLGLTLGVGDGQGHGPHVPIVAVVGQVVVRHASGGEHGQQANVVPRIMIAEPRIDLLVTAHEQRATDPRHEVAELLATECEPSAGLLQLVGDDFSAARIAPQHLEPNIGIVEGREVLPPFGEQGIAGDAAVHEHETVEHEAVRHGLEELQITLKDFVG
jgi:hypothetical protein